jgi:hypothetical protein
MDTMSEALGRVRLKIERAKEHIVDVHRTVAAFLNANPYTVLKDRDAKPGRLIYRVGSVARAPDALPSIIGDALHNMRSTLDHLAYALVVANGATPTKQTAYPIFDIASKYVTDSPAKIQGMSPEAIQRIDATAPYKGGTDKLWVLHELDIIDKHRRLNIVGSRFRSVTFLSGVAEKMLKTVRETWGKGIEFPPMPDVFYKPADHLCPLKAGYELGEFPDTEEYQNVQFRFDVAFSEPGVADAEPVVETLDELLHLVDGIIGRFSDLL